VYDIYYCSAVRRLDRDTLEMTDQLPALFGQLSGIAYYSNQQQGHFCLTIGEQKLFRS